MVQYSTGVLIGSSEDVAHEVQEKTASLGICLLNKKLIKLKYEVFYREYFGFFCGPSHPLFGKRRLRLRDLREYSAVSFGTDSLQDSLRPVAQFRLKHRLDHNIIGHSTHLEEVRRMIICGLGIGPLPIHAVARDVRDGILWRLPPYKKTPLVDIHLVTNPTKRQSRAEIKFVAALKGELAKIPFSDRIYSELVDAPAS